ncbi:hypothetical protein AAHE18_15G127300 [Arachis hypogaea]
MMIFIFYFNFSLFYVNIVSTISSSAIFYAFYEAHNSTLPLSQTSLLIWLQGGPGCSSMIGNFYELAAITQEIPTDQNGVAKHLFAAITRFVEHDPIFKNCPIYITGESYAGKYVPAIGYYILKENSRLRGSKRVNLAGLAIGDGLTDPVTQVVTHAVNAYYIGLRKLRNVTGLATLFDYTRKKPYGDDVVDKFLNNVKAKKALGVNNESLVFEGCSDVSVKYMVEDLVRNTRVLLYQGQHDIQDGVVQVEAWVKTKKWEEIEDFLNAERKIWKVNGELAGYVQQWKSLTNVVVLGAGHLLPSDQPMTSQAMIEDWVLEKGLFQSL